MSKPKISIIIPVRKGESISDAVNSIKKANYPKNLIEIIISQGNQPAKQRNKAIVKAKGGIVYFLDNDSRIQPWSLNLLAKEFSNPKLAVLGGPSLTPKEDVNYFSKLIGYILETHFGALRMRYRYKAQSKKRKATEYELIGANLAIRKEIFSKLPAFDETFYPNEETDLLRRISEMGYRMKYQKNFFIYRFHRKNIFQLINQFIKYGQGRMQQIIKKPKFEDILFSVPVCFVLYIISLTLYHPLWYLLPLLLYALLGFATSFKAAIKYKKADLLFTMPLLFPAIHISYAFGLIKESLRISNANKQEENYLFLPKIRVFKNMSSDLNMASSAIQKKEKNKTKGYNNKDTI